MPAGRPSTALSGEWDAAFDAEFERERQELEQSGRNLTRVLFFVFLGVAVLMLVIAVLTGRSTQQKLAREQPALAQITAMTERKDSQGNSFFYPVVAFDVPDGGRYDAQLSEGSWPPQHRVGDLVTVLYDTTNPSDARIQSSGGTTVLWTWTVVTGVLGVAFLGAAGLAWAMGRQSG
jgi:Protein of unknown function (DUF3592)